MRKLIVLVAATLMLVACGSTKVHDNVDEQVAEDSMQVMDRVIKNVKDDVAIEDVSEDDHELFERYTNKYIDQTDAVPIELEGVDKDITSMASDSLVKYAKGASLESDKETIKENEEYMLKFIESGKAAGEE